MTRPAIALVGALVAAGAASITPASAAIISSSCGSVSGATELEATLSCSRFDGALGSLQSVELLWNAGTTMTLSATNNAAQAARATLSGSSEFYLDTLAGFDTTSALYAFSASTGSQVYAVGETKSFGPFSGTGAGALLNTTNLGGYQGPGFFQASLFTISGFTAFGGGGNLSTRQTTTGNFGLGVRYTYDDAVSVPEPATLGLLGLGLAGLGLSRRRRAG
jgi:FAD/FMN-containing dehydrogenase